MKKRFINLALLLVMTVSSAWAVDYTPKYRLINNPDYPANDLAVATYNLMDYGVDNTGQEDCTAVIIALLKKLSGKEGAFASIGTSDDYKFKAGGILYIPEGTYLVTGQIQVPRGVTIRGDWKKPEGKVGGTVIKIQPKNGTKPYAGSVGNGTFVMLPTSELSNLTFWYPDQEIDNVQPYMPTVVFGKNGYWGNDYTSVRHCTFVNSYIGIQFSESQGGGCPNIFDVYGTPLCQGVSIDCLADVGRFDWLSFSPKYWADSGLEGAPSYNEIRSYTRGNATAFVMRRNDWSYTCNLDVEGYNVGFSAERSPATVTSGTIGQPNGHNYGFNIKDCYIGVDVKYCSGSGIMFTNVNTKDCSLGVYYRAGMGPVQFLGCNIEADEQGLRTDVTGGVGLLMQQCRIKGVSFIQGAQFTSINCTYDGDVNIGPMARAIFKGNTFNSGRYNNSSLYKCTYDETPVAVKDVPVYKQEWMEIRNTKPARAALYVVTDPEFGAVPADIEATRNMGSMEDASSAIQAALDKAGAEGGGVVYLPAGHYRMDKGIRIPKGVELKGAGDIGSVPKGNGAILEVNGVNEGNENAGAFVMMEEGSGIRGVHFNYPNQTEIRNIKKYPYTIRGNKDCYIVNVAARTAYRILDLFTNKCDNHYVDYLAGHAYMNVVRVGGGSENGIVSNIQCNTIAHACGDESKFGCWPNADPCKDNTFSGLVYGQNYEQLDFFIIGDCREQVLYNNFLFGCHDGMRFQKDNGRGAVNCHSLGNAVDGAVNTFVINGIDTELDLTNSQVVALNHTESVLDNPLSACFFMTGSDCDKTVNFFSTNIWGGGDYSYKINGGNVNMYLTNMQSSGAKNTFDVASGANLLVVGGFIKNAVKTNNTTSTSHTGVYATVFDKGSASGSWAADDGNLPISWAFGNTSGMLPRTGWTASSNKNNGSARNAIDGNAGTRWDSGSQKDNAGTYLLVNMQEDYTFNSIILDAASSPNDGPAAYKVEVYQNGQWVEMCQGKDGGAQTVIAFDGPVTASGVRITLLDNTKGNYWSVHEFYLANLDIVNVDMPTAIGGIVAGDALNRDDAVAAVYSLNGMKVATVMADDLDSVTASLIDGVYIIRYIAGGKVVKVRKLVVK